MKRIIGLSVILLVVLFLTSPVSAQNYTLYTNTWQEICSYPGDPGLDYPWDGHPLVSGFWPDDDFERPGGLRAFETTSPADVAENPFYMQFSIPGSLPSQLGGNYSASSGQCFWEAYANTYVNGGIAIAYTPEQDFSGHNVTRAEVGFLFYLNDPTGTAPRTYNIKVDWEKTSPPGEGLIDTAYVNGEMGGGSLASWQTGYVWDTIGIREGYKISSVQIVFPQPSTVMYYLAPSILKIDRVIINGYQPNIGSTPTPTVTRTPTVGPSPTQTTTPRAIWSTPTPGTPQPTAQFPPYYGSVPTRIPPISFPDWDWLLIPTPSSYFTMPLIDTPVIPTRAPFTFTIPISYSTPALFNPPTVTPTATATGTPQNCGAFSSLIGTINSTGTSQDNLFIDISSTYGHLESYPDTNWIAITIPDGCGNLEITGNQFTPAMQANGVGIPFQQRWWQYPYDRWGNITSLSESALVGECIQTGSSSSLEFVSGASLTAHVEFSPCDDPTPTPTVTATPTRADIVASMNLAATNLYSEAAVMSNPTTFTIQSAPEDYAPSLPRPMADIGYTFENMQDNIGFLYDPRAWASLLGYIASVPFQLVKFFHTMAQMMGPVGLFTTWLLILLPFVLFSRMFIFIKNLIISIINLVVKVIRFIGDIWDLFPGL